MLIRLLAAVACNAVALYATTIVPGIRFRGTIATLLVAGAVFGVFNAVVRPIAIFLSIPALILTLGLFYFLMNGILLWIASFMLPGYRVSGPFAGMLGSLVISVVNWAIHAVFGGRTRT